MAVTQLDGRGFGRFVVAGTYFLGKYRSVLNDLNVFPVPDGDTGSNMFLTAKAAVREAGTVRGESLAIVAAAAAKGSLLGARGNSGVILSQMLRGFAHSVRHRDAIDTFQIALGMREAVTAARAALTKPVEGTIISVAGAAAEEAYRLAVREPDLYRLANGIVRAANAALERTPEQLPASMRAAPASAILSKACCAFSPSRRSAPPRFRAGPSVRPCSRAGKPSASIGTVPSSCWKMRRSKRTRCANCLRSRATRCS